MASGIILGVTGHRPPDLGGYGEAAFKTLVELAKQYIEVFEPRAVLQGMALGWDQAVATAAWELGVPYGAYIPFEDQAKTWPKESRYRWATLRDHAEVERVFGQKYDAELMKQRNIAIVDDCDVLLANYNGYKYSGTAHAVNYALSINKPVKNIYDEWKVKYAR